MKKVSEAGRPLGRPKKKQGSSQDSLGPSGENTVVLVSDGDVEIQKDQSTSSFQPNIPSISKKRKSKWSMSLDSKAAPQAKKTKKSLVAPVAIPEASVTAGTKTGPLLPKVSKYKVSKKAGPPLHPGNTHASPVQPSLKKQVRVGGDLRNKSKLGFQFHIRRARGRPPGKKQDPTREIIRLKTTDGFWSSKTSSRSSSPLSLEAFAQKQAENKKGSRTSTPDLSGQKITSQKKGVQENYVSDPLNSITTLPELRRLKTTKGFSFPDITNLGSRVSSRDESPSSSSSLDRGVRTNVRSQNRQTEGTPTEENSQVCVVDMAPKPVRKKSRKSDVSKVLETPKNNLVATPEVSSLGSSKETIQKPASKCKIKDSTDNQAGFIDDDKEPSLKKQKKSKSLSALSPQKTKGRSRFSISSALKGEKKVPRKQNIAYRMTQRKQQNRTCRKEAQASFSDENSVKSLDVGNTLVTGKVDSLVHIAMRSTDESIKTPESRQKSELFPLDLLDSTELKRLNTTAGFWAPTPNFKSVFGVSRLRKNKNVKSVSDSATLNKNVSPKSQKTHLKPQTPLLQHRKKKLQALQNSLRKTKQRLNSHNPEDVPSKCVSSEKSLGNKHCEQKKPKKRPKKDQPSDPIQIIVDVAEDPSYIEGFSTKTNIGNPMETVLPLVQRVKMTKKMQKKSFGQKRLRKDQPSNPIQIVLDIAEDPSHIEGFSTKTNVGSLMETVPPIVQTVKKIQKKPKKNIQQKGLRKDQPSDPIQIVLDVAEDPIHIEEFSTKTNVATPMETVSPLVQRVKKTAKVKKNSNKLHELNISMSSSSERNISDSQILQTSYQTVKKRGRKKKEATSESGCDQSITEVETNSLDKSGSTNKKFTDLDETLKQNLLLSASVASLRTKRQKLKEMKKSFSESESNYSDSPETYQRRDTEAQADILDGVFENMTKKCLTFGTEDNQDGSSVLATIATQLQASQADTLNMSLDSGCGSKKLACSRFAQLDVSDVDIITKTSDNSVPDVVLKDRDLADLEKVHVNSAKCPGSVEKDSVDPQTVVCFNVNNGKNGSGSMVRESPGCEHSEDTSTCKIVCVEAQASYNDSQIARRCETPKYEDKGGMDDNVRLCLATVSNASATTKETLTWGAEKKVNFCEEDKEGGKISDNLKPHLDSSRNMTRDGDFKENNCKSKISIFETSFGYCNEANNVVGNMSHRKDNLFESFGYDLQSSSKLPGASCVKTSAEDVRLSTASPSFQGNSGSYKTEITDESKVRPDYHSVLKSVVEAECKRLDDMNFATDGKVETIIDGESELVCQEKSDIIPASLDSSVDASMNHLGANISDVQKTDAASSKIEPCPTKLKQEISVEIGENNIKEEYSELRGSSVAVEEDNSCVSGVVEVEQLRVAEDSTEVNKDVQGVVASSPKDLTLLNGSKGGDDSSKTCTAARDEHSEEVGRINLVAEINPDSSDVNLIKSRSCQDRTLKSETYVSELAENDLYHHMGVTDENRNVTERLLEDVDKVASLNVSGDVAAKTLCEGASSASRVVESVDGRSGEDHSKEINVSLSQCVELDTPTAESALQNGQKQDLTTTEYVLLHAQEQSLPATEITLLNDQEHGLTKTAIEHVLLNDQDQDIIDTESSLLSHQKQDSTATEYILLYDQEQNLTTTESSLQDGDQEQNLTTTESSLLNGDQEQNLTATESSLINDQRDSTETEYILLYDQEQNLTATESSSLNDQKQDETATEYILLSGTNQDLITSKSELLNEQKQDLTATDSSLLIDQEQDLTADVSDNENSMTGASPEPQIESHVSSSLVFPQETILEKWAQQPGSNPNLSIYIESQEEIDSSNECIIVLCPSPVKIAKATPSSEPVEITGIDDLSLRTNAVHETGINSCTQTAKKMRRRKRNSWQRGVVRKAHSNLARRRAKPTNSGSVRKPKPAVASNQRAVAVTLAHNLNSTTLAAGSLSVIQGQSDIISLAPTIDTYPPAVQKSLLSMLKQLKTNANLANAVLDEKSFSGRFLRHPPSAENKDKKGSERNDKEQSQSLSSDYLKGAEPLSIFTDPEVQAHENSTPLQRKRGRPKKNLIESLPKLTATHTLPSLGPFAPWDVTPPTLSPQESTQQNTTEDPAELLDTSEIVGENVDDSDFHLYLSGISDEELSPKKNSPDEVLSPYSIQVHQVTRDLLEGTGTEKSLPAISSTPSSSLITDVALVPEPSSTPEASFTSAAFLTSAVTSMPDTSLISTVLSTPLRSLSPNDKEPKKRGRPAKIKGKRGRPPGLPMTNDEKEKKRDVAQTATEESSSPEVLRITKKSTPAPEVSSPPGNFSLRKKSTRSPLEMLELKRRQEEAIYDLEQERRQARLTYLREKRSTRESGEGFLDDTEARAHESGEGVLEDTETVPGSDNVMVCSVVLSDFVKKLQLNEPENSSSGSENEVEAEDAGESLGSGECPDDENWCADLQQQYDDQDASNRSDSRPYIPRLKLKRILKKRTPVEKVRIEPEPAGLQRPPERIKLVIKTEPVCEGNEPAVSKRNLLVDNSRVDRLGFESSFMDFLQGKSESLISKVNRRTKHNQGGQILSMNSGQQQPLKDTTATNSSLIKIIVDENSLVDIARIPVDSSPDSNQEESSALLLEGNNTSVLASAYSSGSLNSRPDEEDDDILILDLDESGDEITPHGKLGQNPQTESESVEKAIMTKDTVSQALCGEGEDLIDQAFLRSQRILSNDEMGLMLESYYSPARPDAQLVSDGDQMSICVTSTDTSDMRADNELTTDLNSLLQHRLVSKDQTKSPTGSACMEDMNVESSKAVSETGMKEKGKMTDESSEGSEPLRKTSNQALPRGQKQNPNTTVDSVSDKGTVPAGGEEGSDLPTDAALGSQNSSLEVCDSPTASAVSLKSADSVADDSHATMPMKTPPKISTSAKKPTSDSSRSPKQISCHSGGSEEWRVKVISQSDKCPSGKFSCKRCDFVTSSKLTVESHIYSHIPGVQFRCAHCQAEFSSMTATATHLKNTHSLNEAQLHISRHIEEKNFYEREDGVLEDSSQPQSSPCHPLAALEGQSPPLFISLVVSGSRASRTSAAHRFVCTHCGFSTNVKEAAEHHISDLHSSVSLYTCLLCSESCSEVEIKAHCAKVHPARNHPYKKLPDFYDAEKLGQKDKAVCQEGCEDFYDRVSSVLQDEGPASSTSIDHRQKAKAYLELQEGWREKKRAEADSTTAADYTEEQEDEAEGDEPPASGSVQDEDNLSFDDPPIDGAVNEVLAHVKLKSGNSFNTQDTPELVSKDACITSSAGASPTAPTAEFSAPVSDVPLEDDGSDGGDIQQNAMSCHSKSACSLSQHAAELCEGLKEMPPCEQEGGSDESIGLKIMQVVSLGQLGLDLPMEPVGAEDDSICQPSSENKEQNTDSQIEHMSSPEPVNLSLEAEKVANSTETTPEPLANSAEPLVIPTSAERSGESVVIPGQSVTGNTEQFSPAAPAASTSSSPAAMPTSLAGPPFSGSLPLSYKCNACKVHTPYLLMMVKHLKARHPNMRCFSCPYCKTVGGFVSQKQLRHHVKQAHPDKFGRNEIALSEDAKKFVEAMVLPMGLECIRVGNRIVLEEDIHTCTYCQIRLTSLTSVYEHLNTKHPDLFEYVCPICQIFKNSVLTEIANHCCMVHHVDLDSEQVHVSVPKNLFSILTCISKNGKYIEKSLIAGSESSPGKSQSPSYTYEQTGKSHPVATSLQSQVDQHTPKVTSVLTSATTQSLQTGSIPENRVSAGLDMVPRPTIPFSSALFDTSSFTASPHVAIPASQPIVGHSGAASSFLSQKQQELHFDSRLAGSNKQSHVKLGEKAQGHAKNLPVLNVPTIRPRASSTITKQAGDPSSTVATTEGLSFHRILYSASQQAVKAAGSSSCLENIPESEPSPDAFQIFNLRPAPVAHSASPIPTSTPTSVPSVFPPVSAPMAAGFIQGPIAGFPPSMVIAPSMLPLAFPFPQHRQPMVPVTLVQSQTSSLSRHPHPARTSHPKTRTLVTSAHQQVAAAAATTLLKNHQQQQRELYILRQQQLQQAETTQRQRQVSRPSPQQPLLPRAYPAHQQPPSLSGQVYQQNSHQLPTQLFQYDRSRHHFAAAAPSRVPQSVGVFPTPTPSMALASISGQGHTSSPTKPGKGMHKRSNCLYQCPYCPGMMRLKALEVASHIHQHHSGQQVIFRRIA